MRRIVCAANRSNGEGIIVCGARHFDNVMHTVIRNLPETNSPRLWTQGFIDNRGVFLNRKEALKVAQVAGQIRNKTMPDDRLFSEDLY